MRKTIGYVFLAMSALAWGAILTLPLFGVSWRQAALLATVLIVIGEGAFLLGAALLGKDLLAKVKEYLRRGS
jgi:hypothetical protein